jgi:hypothetical protein
MDGTLFVLPRDFDSIIFVADFGLQVTGLGTPDFLKLLRVLVVNPGSQGRALSGLLNTSDAAIPTRAAKEIDFGVNPSTPVTPALEQG